MKIYVYISIIGFIICGSASLLYLANIVPWLASPMTIRASFICLTSLSLPICIGIFVQIFQKHPFYSNQKTRIVVGFLLGMFIGLLVSGGLSAFGSNELTWFYKKGFDHLLLGGPRESTLEQLRNLLPCAEVLGMLKTFITSFIPISIISALIGALLAAFCEITQAKENK